MDLIIRQMAIQDIPVGMELKEFAHWNQTEADWQVFLQANARGCFAAECAGRVVGTTAAIRYGRSLAWIGMVLVHPEFRGRGIATRLMERALEHLTDCPAIKLDATAAGKKVYEKLGFLEEAVVHRLTTACLPVIEGPTAEIAPLAEAELEPVLQMDRQWFAGDRSFLLCALHRFAPELTLGLTRDGHTVGCCFGRRGSSFVQIGPILAESTEDARQLVCAALHSFAGAAVVLDVPAVHSLLLQWLGKRGFSLQRDFIRMARGAKSPADILRHQYAICGPEFG